LIIGQIVGAFRVKERETTVTRLIIVGLVCGLVGVVAAQSTQRTASAASGASAMELGNFSVSLAVKDLAASREFYEKLGFHVVFGKPASRFLIMQNQTATIGLFQGMFDKNIMTFNPGWDRKMATLADFQDVRDIQRALKERGIKPAKEADESTTAPAGLVLYDPDGNQILIDQHVPKPHK
jgi:catechol 2,3-dioxygenase-like lactoylglutathione lyase family enzyme